MGRPSKNPEEKFWCGHCKHWEARRVGTSENPKMYRCDRCGESNQERIRVRTGELDKYPK